MGGENVQKPEKGLGVRVVRLSKLSRSSLNPICVRCSILTKELENFEESKRTDLNALQELEEFLLVHCHVRRAS